MKKTSERHKSLENLEKQITKILTILEHQRLRIPSVTLPVQRIILDSYASELAVAVKLYLKEYAVWLKHEANLTSVGNKEQDQKMLKSIQAIK